MTVEGRGRHNITRLHEQEDDRRTSRHHEDKEHADHNRARVREL